MFAFQPNHDNLPSLDHEAVPILGVYNPGSGRAEDAADYLDELSRTHDVNILETVAEDPQANADNLITAIASARPKLVVSLGGDSTTKATTNAIFRAGEKRPDIFDIPLVFLPYGTGNDFALSLVNSHDLIQVLNRSRLVDFHPIEMRITSPNGEAEKIFAAGSAGIGALGNSAFHINHENTHGHEDFKHPRKKHILLARAALKGFTGSRPFTMEEKELDDSFGPEQKIHERAFFHALRFGIHGRTRARISDEHLRETVLYGKLTPRTAFYMGCFAIGRVGVRIPSHPLNGYREFRVAPAEGQDLYTHLDDTELPIVAGTEIRVGLAEKSVQVYATRQRP